MATELVIKVSIEDEYAEPGHKMGITEEGFEKLNDALMDLGGSDVDVRPAADVAWPD